MDKLSCFFAFFPLLVTLSAGDSNVCTKPEVSVQSYATPDATILVNIGFVAEFSLKCGNGAKNPSLFAEIGGKTWSLPRIGDNKYQMSWAEDVKTAHQGYYTINLHDEETYASLRKAMRNNGDISSVTPLTSVVLKFPGAYRGPWANSEFMAFALSTAVFYAAYSSKSKLLA